MILRPPWDGIDSFLFYLHWLPWLYLSEEVRLERLIDTSSDFLSIWLEVDKAFAKSPLETLGEAWAVYDISMEMISLFLGCVFLNWFLRATLFVLYLMARKPGTILRAFKIDLSILWPPVACLLTDEACSAFFWEETALVESLDEMVLRRTVYLIYSGSCKSTGCKSN